MAIIINKTAFLDAPISVESLHGVVFSNENKGHKFVITGIRGGELQTFTGSVIARFIRANNTTILMGEGAEGELATCATIEDGKVVVSLARDCYNVPGRFQLTVFVTNEGETSCVYAAVGTVQRSENGTLIDDGVALPSVDELQSMLDEIQQYETNIATAGAAQIAAVQAKGEETLDSIPDDYTALQGEVDDLKSAITKLDGKHILELAWNNGFINSSTLSISSGGSTHVYSDVVLIKAGTMLYLPRVNKSTSTTLLAQCSQDGTPEKVLLQGVSTANSTGEHIMYPIIGDTYVRFGGNKTMSEYMIYYAEDFNYDIVFDNSNYALFNSRITLDYTDGGIFAGGVNTAVGFKRSNIICLPKGMTIEFYGCGSGETGIVTVSRYDVVSGAYVSAISYASSAIQHKKYTATDHMYIRLCARIAPNTSDFNVVLPEDCFYGWKIYYEPNHYKSVMNHALYGKALTAMGDSLIYGNKLSPGGTWITNLGIKYNMTYTNLGDNGNSVARVTGSSETAMVDRTDTIPLGTEYFILEGGSNDKNNNVPLGDEDSTDIETFNGALNTILSAVRARIPKAKILLMTSYQRFKSVNNIGLGDEDYANAIISAGKRHSIPVYDNFHNCGLTFWNDSLVAWIDEAQNRQKLVDGAVTYYQNVQHFSIEAYKWLTSIYEHIIAGL